MNALTNSFPLRDFTNGRSVIQVSIGGVGTGPWNLYGPDREKTLPSILNIASAFDVRSVLIPDVTDFNGRITSAHSMTLSHGKAMDLYHRTSADGVVLEKGQAAAFATGDCPTVIMYDKKSTRLVAAHAGRKSLLGSFSELPHGFAHGVVPENNVIGMMFKEFDFRKVKLEDICVYVTLGISGGHFSHPINHPRYGLANARMVAFVIKKFGSQCVVESKLGTISLFDIIRTQCRAKGIPSLNIRYDSVDTFSDRDSRSGEYLYYSNRRGDKERNLVFVASL
jgi:copper oxidase (laccase) domain-containing protein